MDVGLGQDQINPRQVLLSTRCGLGLGQGQTRQDTTPLTLTKAVKIKIRTRPCSARQDKTRHTPDTDKTCQDENKDKGLG